jgi:hypothetical protein
VVCAELSSDNDAVAVTESNALDCLGPHPKATICGAFGKGSIYSDKV